MGRNTLVSLLAAGACATMLTTTTASAEQDRVSATEKGSLLVFPKVTVTYDVDLAVEDTFISLTNDDNYPVDVQMYFVNGDCCNFTDVRISLTANQPTYWAASSGQPAAGGISPWSIIDCDEGNTVRGFIVAWAVDADNYPIRHDHLAGNAVVASYVDGLAWEYNAYAFQGLADFDGADGDLEIGVDYAPGFAMLLLNFYAEGSMALSQPEGTSVETMTDLTLLPLHFDFRQETDGPAYTKAHMDVWNMNEVKLSGAYACLDCWRQDYLNDLDGAEHFDVANLQTDAGKARIDGLASQLCDEPDALTSAQSLLGVSATYYLMNGVTSAASGKNLVGMGTENGVLMYDTGTDPVPTDTGDAVNFFLQAVRGAK